MAMPGPEAKRQADPITESDDNRLAKRQNAQLEADSALLAANRELVAATVGVTQKRRQQVTTNEHYGKPHGYMMRCLRDWLDPEQTVMLTADALGKFRTGQEAPGAVTRLFRLGFKKKTEQRPASFIYECVLQKIPAEDPAMGMEECGALYISHLGTRMRLNSEEGIHFFMKYVLNSDAEAADQIPAEALRMLYNELLVYTADLLIEIGQQLNVDYFPQRSFPDNPVFYYQILFSHLKPPSSINH